MRIRALRIVSPLLLMSPLALVLTACGGSNVNRINNQGGGMCSGCSFLYASTNAGQILSYQIDSGGTLGTPSSTANLLGSDSPYLVGFGPEFYASDAHSNAIDGFVVNSSNGTLTAMTGSPFSLGSAPGDPDGLATIGNYLYAGNTNGTVSAFNVNPAGGLTAISGSPFAAGFAPVNLAAANLNALSSPVLYAADFSGAVIWAFTIGSDGGLTVVPGSPFAAPVNSSPAGMFVGGSESQGILYVALNAANQIAVFSISASGALTPLPGSPFPAGRGPEAIVGSTFSMP